MNRMPRWTAARFSAALLAGAAFLCVSQWARGFNPQETAALAEMDSLQTALDIFYIDTNYYCPLETLNDLTPYSGVGPLYDYLYNGPGARVIRIETGKFTATPFNPLIGWNGPYVNYQPNKTQIGPTPYDEGSPLDPWGNPYYFFSPMGLIRGDTGAVTLELYADQFDRYAIVSLGQDGAMSSDDLIRYFGTGVTSLAISRISGPNTTMLHYPTGTVFRTMHDSTITLKGYFFGPAQGGSKVFFGSTQLTNILSWSDTLITLKLPPNLFGVDLVSVQVGAAVSNGLQLTIDPNSVENWTDYE